MSDPNVASLGSNFTEGTADVNGIRLHYFRGGQGEPLVLLHGWPQTWFCWHRLMPALAQYFTVIAIDLRGAGQSSRPELPTGYDFVTMANDIRELMAQLGFESIRIAGHDVGLNALPRECLTFSGSRWSARRNRTEDDRLST